MSSHVKIISLLALLGVIAALIFVGRAYPVIHSQNKLQALRSQVVHHVRATWRWQDTMGVSRSRFAHHERQASRAYLRWLVRHWKIRHISARIRATRPPHLSAWLCIHRYEGAWNDPGSPYYGGLQMDLQFQRAYGRRLLDRKGTADHWTPLEQMWVAEHAYSSGRGFYPWPNTARYCGLI
jgi:hypothetical protein